MGSEEGSGTWLGLCMGVIITMTCERSDSKVGKLRGGAKSREVEGCLARMHIER